MGIKGVKFRGRHVSRSAVFFLVTGIISLCLLVVLPILVAVGPGAQAWMGAAGIGAAFVSLAGLVCSIYAVSERDTYVSLSIAAMVVNGISFVLYVIVYFVGMA